MIIVVKTAAGDDVRMDELVALAKGLIGPNDLSNGGDLTPQQSAKLISLVRQNDFLAKINTVPMRRLTRKVDAIDFARRQLKRVPQGEEPEDGDLAEVSAKGAVLTATPTQLFPSLSLDFLRENQDNPNLLSEVEKGFVTTIGNDLVDLGFNGVADDYAGDSFIRLNKGWLHLADNADATPKVEIDFAGDGYQASMAAVVTAADPRSKRDGVLIMNTGDADKYWREIGAHVTGTPLAADSPLRRFEGRAIEPQDDMPAGHIMFTPLKNLAHGIHNMIQRDKAYHSRKRELQYTFDMAVDYEIAVKEFVTLGKPAA